MFIRGVKLKDQKTYITFHDLICAILSVVVVGDLHVDNEVVRICRLSL